MLYLKQVVLPISCDAIKYISMLSILINHIANVFLPDRMWDSNICLYIGYFTPVHMFYLFVKGNGKLCT